MKRSCKATKLYTFAVKSKVFVTQPACLFLFGAHNRNRVFFSFSLHPERKPLLLTKEQLQKRCSAGGERWNNISMTELETLMDAPFNEKTLMKKQEKIVKLGQKVTLRYRTLKPPDRYRTHWFGKLETVEQFNKGIEYLKQYQTYEGRILNGISTVDEKTCSSVSHAAIRLGNPALALDFYNKYKFSLVLRPGTLAFDLLAQEYEKKKDLDGVKKAVNAAKSFGLPYTFKSHYALVKSLWHNDKQSKAILAEVKKMKENVLKEPGVEFYFVYVTVARLQENKINEAVDEFCNFVENVKNFNDKKFDGWTQKLESEGEGLLGSVLQFWQLVQNKVKREDIKNLAQKIIPDLKLAAEAEALLIEEERKQKEEEERKQKEEETKRKEEETKRKEEEERKLKEAHEETKQTEEGEKEGEQEGEQEADTSQTEGKEEDVKNEKQS